MRGGKWLKNETNTHEDEYSTPTKGEKNTIRVLHTLWYTHMSHNAHTNTLQLFNHTHADQGGEECDGCCEAGFGNRRRCLPFEFWSVCIENIISTHNQPHPPQRAKKNTQWKTWHEIKWSWALNGPNDIKKKEFTGAVQRKRRRRGRWWWRRWRRRGWGGGWSYRGGSSRWIPPARASGTSPTPTEKWGPRKKNDDPSSPRGMKIVTLQLWEVATSTMGRLAQGITISESENKR